LADTSTLYLVNRKVIGLGRRPKPDDFTIDLYMMSYWDTNKPCQKNSLTDDPSKTHKY